MSNQIDIVFLGINDAGMQIYEWLCNRKSVFVHSLFTTKDQLQLIKNIQPDYVVSCGYRHIVPEDILNVPTEGCLNLHSAYLPYNRGANPNVWSIVEDTPAGVTLHWMDPDLDTGNIIARKKVEAEFSDSGKELYKKLKDSQVALFQEVWPEIVDGKIDEIEQDENAGTHHRTEDFEELCQLDPDKEVRVKDFLDRLRALTFPPYDNAKIEVDGETYYVEIDISK